MKCVGIYYFGKFKERSNRFLAKVVLETSEQSEILVEAHVPDPGRLKELLYPGNKVLIKKMEGKDRKTNWDVIAANYDDDWILINSGFHRGVAEWVLNNEKINPYGRIKDIPIAPSAITLLLAIPIFNSFFRFTSSSVD